ncbi:MAG: aspartate/glutamate racemase family protein [Mycobacterium sp.]|nr:aspartate/glutamate racemase family protein [Mycobacterium sp.]
MTLGLIDWGIGGIGLLRLLEKTAPERDVIYVSDTGAVPYGRQRTAELTRRLRAVVTDLAERGATEVMLACHSASTVAPRLTDTPIPVGGIIDHALAAVPEHLSGPVGVVGGRRTIGSGCYRRALTARRIVAISRVAQPLSGHIEAGRASSARFREDLHRIVAPIRGADALILACTHYPAAADEFAAALPGTLLIDPAVPAANSLAGDRTGAGSRTFLTTGDPDDMRRAAELAWGYRIGAVAVV